MFGEYLKRLANQISFWLLAGLTILGVIADNFLWRGLSLWPAYLAVFALAVFIGTYRVFIAVARERDELRARLQEVEARRPSIVVGLQHDGRLVKELTIPVKIPPEPDNDKEVQRREEELIARFDEQKRGRTGLDAIRFGFSMNPHYMEEVKDYLEEYSKYLKQRREYESEKERIKYIFLVAENRGSHPADDVTIEFALPSSLSIASDEQLLVIELGAPSPPEAPRVRLSPALDIARILHRDLSGIGLPHISSKGSRSDVQGPYYGTKDGETTVVYKVRRLVPNLRERDFEPFPVWLGNIDQDTSLPIRVTVYAANLPEPDERTLTLDVRMDSTPVT